MEKLKRREEIEDKYKFNLEGFYKDVTEYEKDLIEIKEGFDKLKKYDGHILDSASTLLEILDNYYSVSEKLEKAYVYAYSTFTTDIGNKENQDMLAKAKNIFEYSELCTSYIWPEILESSLENIKKLYKEEPRLEQYDPIFVRLFRSKEHIMNKEMEEIFSQFSAVESQFNDSSNYLRDSIMKYGTIKEEDGNEIELNSQNYYQFIQNQNRDIRKEVYEKAMTTYEQFIPALACNYIGHIKYQTFDVKQRKYKNVLNADLDSLNLPEVVFTSLIEATNNHLDIYKKRFQIFKKCLKVDKLMAYDISAPLVENEKKYSFEDAKDIILEVSKIYGDEYYNSIKSMFDNRWIDVYSNVDKRTGWYEIISYLAHPLVFANYNSKYIDVTSLFHELGHAVHSMFAAKNNIFPLYEETLFTAEVASLTNEMVLGKYLVDKVEDKEQKLEILDNMISVFASNYFNAVEGSEFEYETHKLVENGENVTADILNNVWLNIKEKYTGGVIEGSNPYGWARIPHFFNDFYYYKYATSVAIAMYLSDKILYGTDNDRKNYIKFLKVGNSLEAIDALKVTGVDVTDKKIYEQAILSFDKLLDKFEKLYNEK